MKECGDGEPRRDVDEVVLMGQEGGGGEKREPGQQEDPRSPTGGGRDDCEHDQRTEHHVERRRHVVRQVDREHVRVQRAVERVVRGHPLKAELRWN